MFNVLQLYILLNISNQDNLYTLFIKKYFKTKYCTTN